MVGEYQGSGETKTCPKGRNANILFIGVIFIVLITIIVSIADTSGVLNKTAKTPDTSYNSAAGETEEVEVMGTEQKYSSTEELPPAGSICYYVGKLQYCYNYVDNNCQTGGCQCSISLVVTMGPPGTDPQVFPCAGCTVCDDMNDGMEIDCSNIFGMSKYPCGSNILNPAESDGDDSIDILTSLEVDGYQPSLIESSETIVQEILPQNSTNLKYPGENCESNGDCLNNICAIVFGSGVINTPSICCPFETASFDGIRPYCSNMPLGSPCNSGSICESSTCIDRICATREVPAGEECNISNDCAKELPCGLQSAEVLSPSVCCPSGELVEYGSDLFCSGMPIGSRCKSDSMCERGLQCNIRQRCVERRIG